jgi:hypothetical protein
MGHLCHLRIDTLIERRRGQTMLICIAKLWANVHAAQLIREKGHRAIAIYSDLEQYFRSGITRFNSTSVNNLDLKRATSAYFATITLGRPVIRTSLDQC